MISKIKPYGRLVLWYLGSLYDFIRFCKFGGWKINLNDTNVRNYYIAKVYHSLEKSLSFKNRNINSGWGNARILVDSLSIIKNSDIEFWGYHDKMALRVLNKFVHESKDAAENENVKYVKNTLLELNAKFNVDDDTVIFGTISKKYHELDGRNSIEPDKFFNSRYSIREFSSRKVSTEDILQAVNLSLKTPSACNRQPWHVYHISSQDTVQNVLKYQSGNRGFTDKIQDLVIVCSDIRAFNPGSERYQHWIDGGMYSMSLIYALHALGISTCCLNWSEQGKKDKALRGYLNEIDNSHSIMMMIAVGYPDENNEVCVSPRRPIKEIYTAI